MKPHTSFTLLILSFPCFLGAANLTSPVTVDFDASGAAWGAWADHMGTDTGLTDYINSGFAFAYNDGYSSHVYGFSDYGQNNTPCILLNGGSDRVESLSLSSSTGLTFGLNSFYLNNTDNDGWTTGAWTIEGWLGGVSQGSMTISASNSGKVDLSSYSSKFGNVNSVVISSSAALSGYDYYGFNGASFDTFSFVVPNGAVPEPSDYALALGIPALGLAFLPRRRK